MINTHDSSSKAADVEDLPDVRMEASSPGPRVTFNIQDTVTSYYSRIQHANVFIMKTFSFSFIKVPNAFLVKDFQSIAQNPALTHFPSQACSTQHGFVDFRTKGWVNMPISNFYFDSCY
jgi:hypothetical protein